MSVRYLVMVLVAFTLLSLVGITSEGATITVDDSGGFDYDNIQDAIDNAADGDLVLVNNGSYDGNLVVDVANLTIRRNAGKVIIDANGTGNGSYVIADGVTLLNLNFSNSKLGGGGQVYAGVYVDADAVTIETCELYDNKYGVFAEEVSSLLVTDCDFSENSWGVFLSKVGDSTLEGLEIRDSVKFGISAFTCSDVTIGASGSRDLYIEGAPTGIELQGGCTAITVEMTGTGLTAYGIDIDSVTDIDFTLDLWALPSRGLRIDDSSLIDVTGSIEAEGTCVYVPDSSSVVLTDMYLNGTDAETQKKGLYLYDGSDVTATNIYFGNLREAVYLQDRCNATITDVTFYGDTFYGYDGVVQDSRLILRNVEYLNNSTGTFNAQGSGWVSSRNEIDIEVDLVDGTAAQNADVKVTCEEGTIYATTGFSGTDARTDSLGMIYDIDVPYIYADLSGKHYNLTEIEIDTGTWIGTRDVDTSKEGKVLVTANDPATLNGYVQADDYTSDIPVAFHCIYMDDEGQEPTVSSVWVNGVEHTMTTIDTDFTNAHYEISLPLMRNTYTYWFEFNDTRETTTTNQSEVFVDNAPPVMVDPVETRGFPDGYPWINFTINYTDVEGDVPGTVYMNIDGVNHTMSKSDNTTDYVNGVMYNISLILDNGIFPYYFIANDSLGYWTPTPVAEDLSVNYVRPVLSEGRVSPDNGTASTSFTFRVKYQQSDGKYPDNSAVDGAPYVFFNNRSWPMERQDAISPVFGTYYAFTTSGAPHDIYEFYFHVSDGIFTDMTASQYITVYNTAPSIEFDYDPAQGNEFTPYDLMITVTDPDNDPVEYLTMALEGRIYTWGSPTLPLYERDVDDVSTFNGKEFWMKIDNLHNGFRSYEIETSDGFEVAELDGAFPVDYLPEIQVQFAPLLPDENTQVRFKCNYSDRDENWPDSIQLYFERTSDGTIYGPFDMDEKDRTDKSVWDGKDYQYSRSFVPDNGDYGADSYRYQIVASDGLLETASVWRPFTVEEADNAPLLDQMTFSPLGGTPSTVFTFSVVYSDPDGDAPTQIKVRYNDNVTDLDAINPNTGTSGYTPTTQEYIDGVTYQIKMEMRYSGTYEIAFTATSGKNQITVTNNTGQEIRIRGVEPPNGDDGETGSDFFMLIIVLAIVIPIALGLILGLLTRTKKPVKGAAAKDKEEKEKDEDEDVDWSFDDEDEDADEDEDEDDEDVDWE